MKYEMDITDQIKKVYTKIAHWHNGEETNKTTLIMLSQEIVEDMINFTLSEMDKKTEVGIKKEAKIEEKPKKGLFSFLMRK